MMFGYWKRRYEHVAQSYREAVATINGLEMERDEVYAQLKSATELLGYAKAQNQELEGILADAERQLQVCNEQYAQIAEQLTDAQLANQKLERKLKDIYAAFRVMQDIMDPPNKKSPENLENGA